MQLLLWFNAFHLVMEIHILICSYLFSGPWKSEFLVMQNRMSKQSWELLARRRREAFTAEIWALSGFQLRNWICVLRRLMPMMIWAVLPVLQFNSFSSSFFLLPYLYLFIININFCIIVLLYFPTFCRDISDTWPTKSKWANMYVFIFVC